MVGNGVQSLASSLVMDLAIRQFATFHLKYCLSAKRSYVTSFGSLPAENYDDVIIMFIITIIILKWSDYNQTMEA